MSEDETKDLSTGARRIVESVLEVQKQRGHSTLGANHWLLVLIERHAPMAESMSANFKAEDVRAKTEKNLSQGDVGTLLEVGEVVSLAKDIAKQREKLQPVERDIAAAILQKAGFAVVDGTFALPGADVPLNKFASTGMVACSMLEKFGRDLTQAARDKKLTPVIGREEEVQLVIETLCRRTKRNPVLVGPAGVGKTAIAELLAQRIANNEQVPEMLKNTRVFALQVSTLVAGASHVGEMENRMQAILKEASQPGVILFIDEIHTIIGAGGSPGTSDIASMLKPALSRGDIACIAATTDDEYRRFIESDAALERRFQPLRVNELSAEQTLQVLLALRELFSAQYAIPISDEVLKWLVGFGQQFMRNRHFPDKAVDLLEQSYAYAMAGGKKAITLEDAQTVAQRMVGMPLSLEARFSRLSEDLHQHDLLDDQLIETLLNRLQVTMRGLDIRTGRPNAVILLGGKAAECSETLAEVIAGALFGSVERQIRIDLSRFTHPADISLLVGAPPGYVGYQDSLPLHKIAQTPWCVLVFENMDLCHPQILETISQGLQEGKMMDGRGKPLYLSDTLVILTAPSLSLSNRSTRSLGFISTANNLNGVSDAEQRQEEIGKLIGAALARAVDVVSLTIKEHADDHKAWFNKQLLPDLSQRYQRQGIDVQWDDTLLEWLDQNKTQYAAQSNWEHWVDNQLTPKLIPFIPVNNAVPVTLLVKVQADQLIISKT